MELAELITAMDETVARVDRAPSTTLMPATVADYDPDTGVARVIVDGAGGELTHAQSLCGPLGNGIRVQVIYWPPRGVAVIGRIDPVLVECRASRAANQAIASNSATWISFDTVVNDPHAVLGTAPSTTLTVPSGMDGIYTATLTAHWASSPWVAANPPWVGVELDGNLVSAANAHTESGASATKRLEAGAVIRAGCYQMTGSPVNITAELEVFRVSQ